MAGITRSAEHQGRDYVTKKVQMNQSPRQEADWGLYKAKRQVHPINSVSANSNLPGWLRKLRSREG